MQCKLFQSWHDSNQTQDCSSTSSLTYYAIVFAFRRLPPAFLQSSLTTRWMELGLFFLTGPQPSVQPDRWSTDTSLPHRTIVQAPATTQDIVLSNNSVVSGCLPFRLIPKQWNLYVICIFMSLSVTIHHIQCIRFQRKEKVPNII